MPAFNRRTLLAGATVLAAAQAPWARPARAAETVTLYNGQHRNTTEALIAAFTKATGVAVRVRHAESTELSSQLAEEGAASPADLFFSEQSPPLAALAEKGLLDPVDPEVLKTVPPQFSAKDGTWIGANVRTRVVIYNRKMIAADALPQSVLEFGKPAMAGKFGYVKRDGFQEQVMAIVQVHGRDAALAWLKGVKDGGRNYNGNRVAATAVENGEVAMALSNNYYWFSLAREKGADKLGSAIHTFPGNDVGNIYNVSPAGALKASKNKALAQKFLAFMVTAPAQEAMAATTAEWPVLPGVKSPFALPPLPSSPVTPADVGTASQAYALMREAGLI